MSAYNFKARWVSGLLDGTKQTTLRKDRKDGRVPKVGERFIAFVGMRTKQCRKLFESTHESIRRIEIHPVHGESEFEPMDYSIYRDGKLMTRLEAHRMAKADGFYDLDSFIKFFEDEHSLHVDRFSGYLIKWTPVPK